HWPLGLAGVAAALTILSERAGLAFCLAVPVLPLGNYSFALAALYGIAAAIALLAFWRTPRAGLLAALGAGLGPAGALGLLPVLGLVVRWPARRAASVPVLAATAATGLALALEPFAPRLTRSLKPQPVDETTAAVAAPPQARASATRR